MAGWGETQFTQNDQPTNPMKQVNLGVVDYATCRAGLVPVLSTTVDTYLDATGGETCAGGESMKDACTVTNQNSSSNRSLPFDFSTTVVLP